jgi:sec-independent protein translocase protein TatA
MSFGAPAFPQTSSPSRRGMGTQHKELIYAMGLDNPIHIAFLLILLLLVFGAKRLPEMGRSLGTGMRGFKDSLTGEDVQPARAAEQQLPATVTGGTQAEAPVVAAVSTPVAAPVHVPEVPAA